LHRAYRVPDHGDDGDRVNRNPRRRRLARIVLAVLVVVHVAAFWVYALREVQSDHLQLFLGARERWREGKLDEAARDYRRFAEGYDIATRPFLLRRNFPTEASAWFALGRIDAERGRIDSALDAFRRAMDLERGRGRREYRDLLLESGRAAELERFARDEVRRDPESAVAYWDLGAALLAAGRPADAAEAYGRALARLPALLARYGNAPPAGQLTGEEADLLNLMAVAQLEAGDRATGAATCDSLAMRQPKGTHLDRLCRAYLLALAGDRDAVAEQLRSYQPLGPEHAALVARLRDRLGIAPPPTGVPYVEEDEPSATKG
jgi:tetratricopeptide (TPR) repeat protein